MSPSSSVTSGFSTRQASQEGAGREAGKVVPQHLQDPSSTALQSGGRDKPSKGAGPVPLSPTPSPNSAGGFRSEVEAAEYWERAAIREFDGALPRVVAERLAWADVLSARAAVEKQSAEIKKAS